MDAAAGSAVWTVRAINSYQGDSHNDPDVSLPGLLANDKSVVGPLDVHICQFHLMHKNSDMFSIF